MIEKARVGDESGGIAAGGPPLNWKPTHIVAFHTFGQRDIWIEKQHPSIPLQAAANVAAVYAHVGDAVAERWRSEGVSVNRLASEVPPGQLTEFADWTPHPFAPDAHSTACRVCGYERSAEIHRPPGPPSAPQPRNPYEVA